MLAAAVVLILCFCNVALGQTTQIYENFDATTVVDDITTASMQIQRKL